MGGARSRAGGGAPLSANASETATTVEFTVEGDGVVIAQDAAAAALAPVVSMDRHMPECDGPEATRRIREREQTSGVHLPIVGVTASVQPEDLEACRAAGMDEVLTTPLPLERLREVLETYAPPKRRSA